MKEKLLILVNDLNYFLSHRYEIVKKIIKDDLYEVVLLYGERIDNIDPLNEMKGLGIRSKYLPFKRSGLNIFKELFLFYRLYEIFKSEKPDLLFLITMKPYLYGGILAKITKIESVVSVVSGMGYIFSANTIKSFLLQIMIKPLFKFAFNNKNQVIIFQNSSDKNKFIKFGVSKKAKKIIINGAGVKLSDFNPKALQNNKPTIVFAARLIKEKGIYEFINAANYVISKNFNARFIVVGNIDKDNPNAISEQDLEKWHKKKVIEYLGFRKDIPKIFGRCHIICLPSYYGEGMPKVLLEAAAAGRAIITTTNPGCKEAIIENKTGFAITPRNYLELAESIIYLLENMDICNSMGVEGRKLAVKEYSIELVVKKHLKIFHDLSQK